ncbi:hypothetical protein BKA65DRAFT_512576 [Rhexocercosporidium sp. MPI-PUGE-AT-0058]|nr:hypothetical protein BKA65DRAFT_512576 [Rhexocercosporidium sp. MPI-PUGE-AT-0058]
MADLGAGALFGAINTAFKFSEFAIELAEVGSENNVFVRTIQRVRLDLDETERLLRVPAIRISLANNPQKLFWIQHAINSTKCALNDIGLFVERVRSDQDRDDTVSFINRVRWVLNDHGKLENRRSELATCHQTLTTVLNTLHPLEMLASFSPTVASPGTAPPPTYESVSQLSDFTSPYNRKKRRMKVLETEVRDTKETNAVPDPVHQEPPGNFEPSTVVPPLDSQIIPDMARSSIQRSSTTSGIPNKSAASPLSLKGSSGVDTTGLLETASSAPDRPRAVSCTGTNLLGPINSWDMWKDYLERPSISASVDSPAPTTLQAPESLPVETPPFYTAVSPVPPLTIPLRPYEIDESPMPSMSQISYQQPISSTAMQQTTSPLEIDCLHITAIPPPLFSTPQYQTRPMSTSLSELYQTAPLERPSTRRYTSFQASNCPAEVMGNPSPYKAYSKPHIPQLRPGFEHRGTYPSPSHVPPYPNYLPERSAQSPIDQASRKFCPYPTDPVPMPTGLEYFSPPRRTTSPALSFVSEVSAMESVGASNEISPDMHPASLRPGCQINRTAVSQSRRRRGLMEAALGVIGEK